MKRVFVLLVLLLIFSAPCADARRTPVYRLGFIGLGPLTVTSTGFTGQSICATLVNNGSQAVTNISLSAIYDDARVTPSTTSITRTFSPGVSVTENCVYAAITPTVNVIIGRIESLTFADGTILRAEPLPPRVPLMQHTSGSLTAADGSSSKTEMPIRLDICQAAVIQFWEDHVFRGLDVTYENVSDAVISHVDFEVHLQSGTHTFQDFGPIEPGKSVTHNLQPTPPIGKNEVFDAFLPCRLTHVAYADGRVWTPLR